MKLGTAAARLDCGEPGVVTLGVNVGAVDGFERGNVLGEIEGAEQTGKGCRGNVVGVLSAQELHALYSSSVSSS